jgi:asparagine synthase (glutamine-hydrolysing)
MCGIAGIWSRDHGPEELGAELAKAVRSLGHRGPDGNGTWLSREGVALGHTRLSIIDLSDNGRQPMTSADGRYVLVFNGEIYNYAEIRAELNGKGHTFIGHSDTEVILAAYREWGIRCLDRMIGMFAIALWDEAEKTLFLARDRLGVKPLYFGWHGTTLCFGSELKALRAFAHWDPIIDRTALGEFFQYGCISGDRSIYEGVRKLPPGHYLTLKERGNPAVIRYWSVADRLHEPFNSSDEDIESELESLLISAAKYRMVSDVPVGVYLSGGIDSSLVTALLAKHHSTRIKTYTIGFREDSHNEASWARGVAAHCGTQHTEYILEASDALSIAEKWGSIFDEPFGDSSGIPTLMVSRLAGKEVKVVLSADGGDELFGGYRMYQKVLHRLELIRRVPPLLRNAAARAIAALNPAEATSRAARAGGGSSLNEWIRRLSRLQRMLDQPSPGVLFDFAKSRWSPAHVDVLVGGYKSPRPLADTFEGDDLLKMCQWDLNFHLPEDLLTKVDRTTMAASIEGREPLLDHRVVEFAMRTPSRLKIGSLGAKHLLKSIVYRYVPRRLLDRRKQGFAIPLDSWLRSELRDLAGDYLSEARIRASGILDWKTVARATNDFYAGTDRLKAPLWYVIAFEMWRDAWNL